MIVEDVELQQFYQELLKEKSNPRLKGNRKGIRVKGKEFYIPILKLGADAFSLGVLGPSSTFYPSGFEHFCMVLTFFILLNSLLLLFGLLLFLFLYISNFSFPYWVFFPAVGFGFFFGIKLPQLELAV